MNYSISADNNYIALHFSLYTKYVILCCFVETRVSNRLFIDIYHTCIFPGQGKNMPDCVFDLIQLFLLQLEEALF